MNGNGLQVSVNILSRIESDLSMFEDGRSISDDTLDSIIVSLEFVYRELLVLEATSQLNQLQEQATDFVKSCLFIARSISEYRKISEFTISSRPPVNYTALVGRPSFEISYDQLLYLIENRFSVAAIADMLGVSARTIWMIMGYQLEISIPV